MSIIKKCISELESPEPRLDYVRGMLETYYDMSGEKKKDEGIVNYGAAAKNIPSTPSTPSVPATEEVPISPAFNEFIEKVKGAKIE